VRPDHDAPVVALDIDGTAGDYHAHFTAFAEAWTGRKMPDPAEYTGGVPFHKHLGVSRETYRTMKLAYRQGGLKRSMPVYEGIGEFSRYVRSQNVRLWICTTRPYLRLDNIDPDTRHWLRKRAGIQYDGILYGEHKYRDLAHAVGVDNVLVVYDDLPAMIQQALDLGIPACLRAQPYNEYWCKPGSMRWLRAGSGIPLKAHTVDDMRVVFDAALTLRRKHE
jgi:hypothetical protein